MSPAFEGLFVQELARWANERYSEPAFSELVEMMHQAHLSDRLPSAHLVLLRSGLCV